MLKFLYRLVFVKQVQIQNKILILIKSTLSGNIFGLPGFHSSAQHSKQSGTKSTERGKNIKENNPYGEK